MSQSSNAKQLLHSLGPVMISVTSIIVRSGISST